MQLRDRSRKFIGPSPTNASSEAMFGKSAAVITAFTPGSASAFFVLIDLIRAWACGLRLTLPHSMPGITVSAPNWARPITLSTPSGRIGRVPTTLRPSEALLIFGLLSTGCLRAHDFGGVHHGAENLVVARAAAQIAGQPIPGFFLGRIGVAVEQRLGGDDKAGGAEPALKRGMLEEFLLHRVERIAVGDALDRRDRPPLGLDREHQARAGDVAVDDDGAGAAIARAAAFLAAGQPELVAQHIEHRLLRLAQIFGRFAVNRRRNVMLTHRCLPKIGLYLSASKRDRKRSPRPGGRGRPRPWCGIRWCRACR